MLIEREHRNFLVPEPSATTDRSYMSVVYSALCSDSWNSYLSAWNGVTNHTTTQSRRFSPWTVDGSTQGQINGSWVQKIVMIDVSNKFNGRIVNNVPLAIPHPGILKAARNKSNSIAQPNFEGGVGRYQIRAQIPSPYLNVICTNVKRSDLEGLVYEDQVKGQLNNSHPLISDKDPQFVISFNWEKYTKIKSPLDNIFNWNNNNNNNNNKRPDLGKENSTQEYTLCSIQAGLLVNCSTKLSVAGNSSVLTAHCDDSSDSMSYAKRDASARDTVRPAYVAVGSLATTSVGLNNGELGNPADNMNYLTKLILKNATLPLERPSVAEGLAAFLLPSLVMAAQDSPLDMSSSTEWKISCDPNKKMEIVQVSPVSESGGSPNDAMRSSGFTPLLATRRGKGREEENIEMV
ncbi:Protoheme IX farnesyltransferase [Venturia nashicola]|uniref:Protoheme IX farnesyltransferase n=1 Tax=Venturia nashicola TaxID=86259 RepID=A0A4Z1P667_9PEZI|nr:Protoheme IX farnesyltransferase [Venturia nashicola]